MPRKDSAYISTQIFTAAALRKKPPKHLNLSKKVMPFWDAIISARLEWTDVDLAHACNLARCQFDIERIQKEILKEGDILTNARGTQIMNPKHALLETLSRRSVALSRMIQVHAAATIGESKLGRGKNSAKREAQQSMDPDDDDYDDLLDGSVN